MSAVISGRVAAIIDDTALVLNVGYQQGVQEGMVFVIFAEQTDITDPDSGESLGMWEMVKARVVVTHVQERMCTVRAPVAAEKPVSDGTRPLSVRMVEHSLGHYGRQAEGWQRLEVRAADISGRPQIQPIAVGDRGRSVAEEAAATEGEEGDAPAAE